ncbi:DMT family transporter [Aquabacterium sp.]|uniref:DMT family transporter n=1 Tax=Aquabacterium sp. TaxID=1872578 RepID=UPI003783FF1F
MPAVFVLIWSTGFIVARYGMPHAPPLTFLSWRYALSLLAFTPWIWLARAPWPRGPAQWWHLAVSGVLMHAGYLGGVWAAVRLGMSAGTVALIVGLQPLLTAVWVSWQGEHRVSRWQASGLLLGLLGLGMVVGHKLHGGIVTPANLALALMALASITVGTLYQKRHVSAPDVRTGNFVQLAAAWLVSAPLSWIESSGMQWHPELVGALAWSVLVLSLGGSSLLMWLIQRGAATRVTSLLYLVPPCTAVLAWLLFDETLAPMALAGMVLCVLGVALVLRAPAARGMSGD